MLLLRALLALVFVAHGVQKLVPGVGGLSPGHEARRFERASIWPAREMTLLTGVLQVSVGGSFRGATTLPYVPVKPTGATALLRPPRIDG